MNKLQRYIPIISILLLALLLRLPYMTRSFFYDELYIAVHGVQAHGLFEALYRNFSLSNHLGYTALAYLTCRLAGSHQEWVMRLPALLFGLGGIFYFWHFTRRYFGEVTALMGALLLTLAPAHIIWSASARGYSACVFMSLVSTSLYFSVLQRPLIKTAVLLALTNMIAPSFHVCFLCVFLTQILHFSLVRIKSTLFCVLLSFGITIVGGALIYLPVLPYLSTMAADHRAFISGFPLALFRDLLSLPWPGVGLCLVLMFLGWICSANDQLVFWRLYIAVLFLFVLPVWFSKPVYLYPRFFAYLLPFFFLLTANALANLIHHAPARAKALALVLTAGFLGWMLWVWFSKPAFIIENFNYKFRESVQFAEKAAPSAARFCAFGNEDSFFQFYARRPVATFKTLADFQKFYAQEGQIVCFAMMGPPMPDEHKKIFLFLLTQNARAKNFDNIYVFNVKGLP